MYCQRLVEENTYEYEFEDLPVMSGKIIDYLVSYLFVMIEQKTIERDHESIIIYLSILHNMSFH